MGLGEKHRFLCCTLWLVVSSSRSNSYQYQKWGPIVQIKNEWPTRHGWKADVSE